MTTMWWSIVNVATIDFYSNLTQIKNAFGTKTCCFIYCNISSTNFNHLASTTNYIGGWK
jgi:hypothetical protein